MYVQVGRLVRPGRARADKGQVPVNYSDTIMDSWFPALGEAEEDETVATEKEKKKKKKPRLDLENLTSNGFKTSAPFTSSAAFRSEEKKRKAAQWCG